MTQRYEHIAVTQLLRAIFFGWVMSGIWKLLSSLLYMRVLVGGGGFCDGSARAIEDHKDYSINRPCDQAIDHHADQG
jgi:hypothetical protein